MRMYTLTLVVTLAMAATASASASLDWTETDLGSGLTGYTFYLVSDQPAGAAYVNISFWADGSEYMGVQLGTTINQLFGTAVNDEATAQTFLGADAPKDTWAYLPFGANAAPGYSYVVGTQGASISGFAQTATSWTMACGSGTETPVSNGSPIANVVSDGDIAFAGVISIDQDYLVGPPLTHYLDIYDPGVYEIGPGESIWLDPSIDDTGTEILTVDWDLDGDLPGGDADFETAMNVSGGLVDPLEITYDYLVSLGMEAGNAYTIGVHATGTWGHSDTTYTTLTLVPEPATLALLGLGAAAVIRRKW